MRTLPALRSRMPSEQVAGAATRILLGDFGIGSPTYAFAEVDPRSAGVYHYHEGDLFAPGAGNWVFESIWELNPIQAIWGNAFLVAKATPFKPLQTPQVMTQPRLFNNGIGGLQAGQIDFEPLLTESE